MALVVFLKGVNVGGQRVFRPSLLAQELADLGAINVGAAGTFVIRERIDQARLRAEFLRRLPFQAEVMICRAGELLDLAGGQPFPEDPSHQELRRLVSVLAKRPRALPGLPFSHPGDDRWEVKVIGVSGRFVLSYWRRLGRGFVEPNGVVEKNLGVLATTRSWNTISAIVALLKGG
jgi:uncharacterized protein (DUF1697 family)